MKHSLLLLLVSCHGHHGAECHAGSSLFVGHNNYITVIHYPVIISQGSPEFHSSIRCVVYEVRACSQVETDLFMYQTVNMMMAAREAMATTAVGTTTRGMETSQLAPAYPPSQLEQVPSPD